MIAEPRRAPPTGEASSTAPSEQDDSEQAIDHALVCVACEHPITKDSEATEAFSGHVHDRVNPAGVVFRIGLFSRADGAPVVGPSSDEFAWFPHHRWRIALCGGCFAHVGWHFSSGSSAFFGLILDALAAK